MSQTDMQKIQILEEIYQDINGYTLSNDYRKAHNIEEKSLTYGEIKIPEFSKILEHCAVTAGQKFYDIGSGTGKTCLLANFVFGLNATGIEIVPDLYQAAEQAKAALLKHAPIEEQLNFINADVLTQDFSAADIVFFNSTCFSDDFWDQILTKIAELKEGCKIICLTRMLPQEQYELLFETRDIEFSWGKPTVRIFRKLV